MREELEIQTPTIADSIAAYDKNLCFEFFESIAVADLIEALKKLHPAYKVCVNGCGGGAFDITQIIPDDRGFVEIFTFNSREHETQGQILDMDSSQDWGWPD